MYIKQPIFWLCLVLLALLAVLNNLAFNYYLYWRWFWFDKLMHFLAGLLIAWCALWLYFTFFRPEAAVTWKNTLLVGLISTLVIGGVWELLEFGVDSYFTANIGLRSLAELESRFIYSVKDLLADAVGGLLGVVAFKTQSWLQA